MVPVGVFFTTTGRIAVSADWMNDIRTRPKDRSRSLEGVHHLEELRALVGEAMDFRCGQEADVIGVAEVAHERVDEVRCGNYAPGAALGWDRDVGALRRTEQVASPAPPSKRGGHMGSRDAEQCRNLLGRDPVTAVRDQPVGEVPWPCRGVGGRRRSPGHALIRF
jgi:hypothetical protein